MSLAPKVLESETGPKPAVNWPLIEKDIVVYKVSDILQRVMEKVDNHDDLTQREKNMWLDQFCYIISDAGRLSSDEMLHGYDWWLRCIEYHSSIDDMKMKYFEDNIDNMKKMDNKEFLNYVTDFFTLDELNAVDITELS